jgi:hypothetical protein
LFTSLLGATALQACGGGSSESESATQWVSVPDHTLKPYDGPFDPIETGPNRLVLKTTEAHGLNIGAGVFRLRFDIMSLGYWQALSADGLARSHIAVIARCDINATTEIWGAGLALGAAGADPVAQLESWRGEALGHILSTETASPVLPDATRLSVELAVSVDEQDRRYLRYVLHQGDTLLNDCGTRLDENTQYDPRNTALSIAYSFSPAGDWAVSLTNIRYAWEPFA